MRIHKNLGHPQQGIALSRFANWWSEQDRDSSGEVNSRVTFVLRTNLRKVICLRSWHTYTEFTQGVGVDLFVLADSNEQVFDFLNIVDLATRFNICSPVSSKRLDDALLVLEMVWINWAGPMSHLISDMGMNSKGELGDFMEAHGIR